ncbi:stage II sporulation protein D [Paenibacillus macerans]|uniref:stage II sporulation protein D n=6 Tax=Paenibacillus macerans TaxID=44252 RepID=UPI000DFF8D28|nr:stage II sporulation protein D [Paenibacillus macerans]SUD25768.1 stage II sporulation protein D [Paenibacillus macerans]
MEDRGSQNPMEVTQLLQEKTHSLKINVAPRQERPAGSTAEGRPPAARADGRKPEEAVGGARLALAGKAAGDATATAAGKSASDAKLAGATKAASGAQLQAAGGGERGARTGAVEESVSGGRPQIAVETVRGAKPGTAETASRAKAGAAIETASGAKPRVAGGAVRGAKPGTAESASGAKPRVAAGDPRGAERSAAEAPARVADARARAGTDRVRVSVRTRKPPIRRQAGGWGGRRAAWQAALAALALALLLPALHAWRAAHAPAARTDPAAVPGTPPAAVQAPAPPGAAGANPPQAGEAPAPLADTPVRVYLSRTGAVETVPLEQYVTGVIAAEMPADFELAALKAQAIAARTFIVRRLAAGDTSGVPAENADVTDTVDHQVYLSRSVLNAWKTDGKAEQLAKLQEAVRQTQGIVMTYRGQPITASFFSSSGGYTENSEEYWSLKIPYLRSVPSPWDASVNPGNRETVRLPVAELFGKLGQEMPEDVKAVFGSGGTNRQASASLKAAPFKVLSWTTGRRVKEVRVGGKAYTGREVREKLGLRSSQFTMTLDAGEVKITTYGYGHGVGMSQWGANGMAKQGFTATQILKHYYTGIAFQQASHFLK